MQKLKKTTSLIVALGIALVLGISYLGYFNLIKKMSVASADDNENAIEQNGGDGSQADSANSGDNNNKDSSSSDSKKNVSEVKKVDTTAETDQGSGDKQAVSDNHESDNKTNNVDTVKTDGNAVESKDNGSVNNTENQNEQAAGNSGADQNEQAGADNQGKENVNGNRDDLAKEYKNTVAQFVHSLSDLADKEGGIGQQVKVVAQAQNDSQTEVDSAITAVDDRSGFLKFLIGPNYGQLNNIKTEISANENRIQVLTRLMGQIQDANAKTVLQDQVNNLQQQNTQLQNFVNTNESKASIFGWLVRLFS